jgi:aspartokinase/homoserine dehydrogenase 1
MSEPTTRVLKFGGTSLATPERMTQAADIVLENQGIRCVVVSALGGVTDALVELTRVAEDPGGDLRGLVDTLRERHEAHARAVAPERDDLRARLQGLHDDLDTLVTGVALLEECSSRTLDRILSFGELMSAEIFAALLAARGTEAKPLDARPLVLTDGRHGAAQVRRKETEARLREAVECMEGEGVLPVVTGFVGSTDQGHTTTLGRSGSDYTGALLSAALDAGVFEIWTDVPGVMSADPRWVPQAFTIPEMSYEELLELSHFGAEVVHPPAVRPARERGVEVAVRSTFRPDAPGTRISRRVEAPRGTLRGLSSVDSVALLRLEGEGMVGVPGVASRLFGALARAQVSVILISQASSEHTICFAVDPTQTGEAIEAASQEFEAERKLGWLRDLVVEEEMAIVACVGEGMRHTPGIAGQIFGTLGHHGIEVHAIAQGSSERNVSLVVKRREAPRSLRVLHDAFFTVGPRVAEIYVAGTGRVGSALLDQLASHGAELVQRRHVRLAVRGLARSSKAWVEAAELELGDWKARLEAHPEVGSGDDDESAGAPATGVDRLAEAARRSEHAARIFVDCTASAEVTEHYAPLLEAGVAVVTANKLAVSGPPELYRRIRSLGLSGNGLFFETTVGAGLPVLRTVADLVASGDRIHSIDGVLSGTLGFLFHRLRGGLSFSEALRDAYEQGLTEPDPREDLSGRDVARKAVILAREAGIALDMEDVELEPLLPDDPWAGLTLEEFWDRLPDLDPVFEARREDARADGGTLCFLATVKPGGATVGLTVVPASHPAASLDEADNLIAVTSDLYEATPLVVRGPGAGPEVTAAGVFSDVLRAALEARHTPGPVTA